MVLIIWLMARSVSYHAKKYRPMNAPFVPRVNLLGAPDMENDINTLDNDMIMQMMRDYLVQRTSGLGGYRYKYFPPSDCAALLKDYLDLLEPYDDQLRDLGYKRIWYLRRYLFNQEKDGRWSLQDDSSYGQNLIRCLAEVAEVFMYYPFKESFEKEITEALADARRVNISEAMKYMSEEERATWHEERLSDLRRALKLKSELEEIRDHSAEPASDDEKDA